MTDEQAAEVLRDLAEALTESPTIRVRALRATLRALRMAVVALDEKALRATVDEAVGAVLEATLSTEKR